MTPQQLAAKLEESFNGHMLHIDLDRQQIEMICSALRAVRPEEKDMVLLPLAPTVEMLNAGTKADADYSNNRFGDWPGASRTEAIYRAMLSAVSPLGTCFYEPRDNRAWCRVHGFDCPNNSPMISFA